MTYCLDTNTLIDAWHFWYAPDTHPTFWQGIEDLASHDRLMIPEQVLQELDERADNLYEWCKDRKDLLVHAATPATEKEYARLVNAYPELTGQLGLGNDYADLYVVAIASVNEGPWLRPKTVHLNRTQVHYNATEATTRSPTCATSKT